MNFRTAYLPVFVAVAALTSVAALADDLVQTSIRVGYADLDITSAAGHAALVTRINKAADQACGPLGQGLEQRMEFRECRQTAIDAAMPAIHAAYASAQHKSQMAAETMSDQTSRNGAK